jgi:hypothetical protein
MALAARASRSKRAGRDVGHATQHLEGHPPLQLLVEGLEHHRHATLAQGSQQQISARDAVAGLQRQ